MKYFTVLFAVALLAILTTTGCTTALTGQTSASALPVALGAAGTNDTPAVAWLELAQKLNAQANPTPTEPIVNLAISGLLMLAAAAGTYYAHKSGVQTGSSIASDTPPTTSTPAPKA